MNERSSRVLLGILILFSTILAIRWFRAAQAQSLNVDFPSESNHVSSDLDLVSEEHMDESALFVEERVDWNTGRAVPVVRFNAAPTSDPRHAPWKKLSEARDKLTQAKADSAKASATNELEKALIEYFEADMEMRRKELDEIRERVQEMELHLSKRSAAKDEIVQLQLKAYLNESQGLGFFRDAAERSGNPLQAGPWSSTGGGGSRSTSVPGASTFVPSTPRRAR